MIYRGGNYSDAGGPFRSDRPSERYRLNNLISQRLTLS